MFSANYYSTLVSANHALSNSALNVSGTTEYVSETCYDVSKVDG